MTGRNGTAIEKKIDTSLNYYGTVLNAQTLEHAVPNLRNSVEKIIVIENKANYESMEYDPKVLYIFCHGYFSPKEVRFLQMLMKTRQHRKKSSVIIGAIWITVEYRFFCIMKRIFFQI